MRVPSDGWPDRSLFGSDPLIAMIAGIDRMTPVAAHVAGNGYDLPVP